MKIKKITLILIFSLFASIFYSKNYTEAEIINLRESIVKEAKTYIGCPYKLGAIGPNAFDCSGLIYTVFRNAAKIQLPRSAKAIYSYVEIVSLNEIEAGDLVFFKTSGNGTISHVGIYIGRNQFIHAASDGSNTGVIVSSLNEKYYKNTYAAVGKPLPSAKKKSQTQDKKESPKSQKQSSSSSAQDSTSSSSTSSFANQIEFDATLSYDWAPWLPDRFVLNYRGISLTSVVKYTKWKIQPGIGTTFRWNSGTECFQIPIFFNLSTNKYLSLYLGPVITCGTPYLPDSNTKIKSLFFPGILGISLNTPKIKIGSIELSLTSDLFYTFYVTKKNNSLSFVNSITSGLEFTTGIRVTFPLKNML